GGLPCAGSVMATYRDPNQAILSAPVCRACVPSGPRWAIRSSIRCPTAWSKSPYAATIADMVFAPLGWGYRLILGDEPFFDQAVPSNLGRFFTVHVDAFIERGHSFIIEPFRQRINEFFGLR